MLLPLTLTTPELFEAILWVQHITRGNFLHRRRISRNLLESMWETLSQDAPKRGPCAYLTDRQCGFQEEVLSVYFPAFLGVCITQPRVYLPTKDEGRNAPYFPLKLFGVKKSLGSRLMGFRLFGWLVLFFLEKSLHIYCASTYMQAVGLEKECSASLPGLCGPLLRCFQSLLSPNTALTVTD